MGSGFYLRKSIKKHGIENFKKEILFNLSSEKEINDKEKELVNIDFIKRDDTYNRICGGEGSWEHVNKNPELRSRIPYKSKAFSEAVSRGVRKAYAEGRLIHTPNPYFTFKNKKHTEEYKIFIGKQNSKLQSGKGNSQYGKRWISNIELKQSKKVSFKELSDYLNRDWIKGRKFGNRGCFSNNKLKIGR